MSIIVINSVGILKNSVGILKYAKYHRLDLFMLEKKSWSK